MKLNCSGRGMMIKFSLDKGAIYYCNYHGIFKQGDNNITDNADTYMDNKYDDNKMGLSWAKLRQASLLSLLVLLN